MTPERWRKIKEIFQVALDLPPADRAAYLRETCAGNQEVMAEVESLLASVDDAGAFLSEPAAAYVPGALDDYSADGNIGPRIGPYQVVREIGQGGMGTVYLAERIGEFQYSPAF